MDNLVEKLKSKSPLYMTDIAYLLKSIGEPGENQTEKLDAVKQLNMKNFQGIPLEESIKDYPEY